MKFDGKALAEIIYTDLSSRVQTLQNHSITPTLAVVLIGDDPGSVSYVSQKEHYAKQIGVSLHIDRLPSTVTEKDIRTIAEAYNTDPEIHGVIIQRPAPLQITAEFLDTVIIPEKDVDGFHPDSDFAAPVALAVERILYEIYKREGSQDGDGAEGTEETKGAEDLSHPHASVPFVPSDPSGPSLSSVSSVPAVPFVTYDSFSDWLLTQHIVVMGKGQTAGAPIISHFHGRNAQIMVIDSETEHPAEILAEADIIITAVGKADVIPPHVILRDKIIIGVGLHTENGKLRGDYRKKDVSETAAWYTPTPGGVGPVNVAMLLSNVVRAAEEQRGEL